MDTTTEYDLLLALVQKRRSIRRFKPDPIPAELIDKIIEVARWAPSGFNLQPWEFVVIQKEELRRKIVDILSFYWAQSKTMESTRPDWQGRAWKLSGMTGDRSDFSQAPVYILVCGDPRTQAGLPMGVQQDRHRRRLIHDAGLAGAFLYMHLAATALGLASQWLSAVQTPYAACMIKDLLQIPPVLQVYDMMVLGYPGIKAPDKLMRPFEEIVHWDDDHRDTFRSDDAVRTFIRKARNWTIGTHHRTAKT